MSRERECVTHLCLSNCFLPEWTDGDNEAGKTCVGGFGLGLRPASLSADCLHNGIINKAGREGRRYRQNRAAHPRIVVSPLAVPRNQNSQLLLAPVSALIPSPPTPPASRR